MDIKVKVTRSGGGQLLTSKGLQEQSDSRGGPQRLEIGGYGESKPDVPEWKPEPAVLKFDGNCDAAQHHIDKAGEALQSGLGSQGGAALNRKYQARYRALQKKLR